MSEPSEEKRVVLGKNRMESLTDGIFAFAMTLLVTSMILPRSATVSGTAGAALISLIPDFIHYLIAFFILAGFWIAHHVQFSQIRHLDRNFISMGILGLFFVTLVPFSTSFIGDYPDDTLAAVVFELNLMLLGIIFLLQWHYAAGNYRLVSTDYPEIKIREAQIRGLVIPFISFIGIILALTGFDSSSMVYLLAPVVFYLVHRYTVRTP